MTRSSTAWRRWLRVAIGGSDRHQTVDALVVDPPPPGGDGYGRRWLRAAMATGGDGYGRRWLRAAMVRGGDG